MGRKIIRHPIPTLTDALAGQQQVTVERVLKAAEEPVLAAYKNMAEDLLEHHDSVTLLAATLKLLTKEPDTTPVHFTEEAPPRERKSRTSGSQRHIRGPRRSRKK